jgi:hypothetical protein
MPVTAVFAEDHEGVVVTCNGIVTGDELVDANARVAACASCRYQLWDFTATTRVVAGAEAIHRLAIQDSAIPEWAALEKIAVIGRDESVEELTKFYELYSSAWVGRRRDYAVRQFSIREQALAWLGVTGSAASR